MLLMEKWEHAGSHPPLGLFLSSSSKQPAGVSPRDTAGWFDLKKVAARAVESAQPGCVPAGGRGLKLYMPDTAASLYGVCIRMQRSTSQQAHSRSLSCSRGKPPCSSSSHSVHHGCAAPSSSQCFCVSLATSYARCATHIVGRTAGSCQPAKDGAEDVIFLVGCFFPGLQLSAEAVVSLAVGTAPHAAPSCPASFQILPVFPGKARGTLVFVKSKSGAVVQHVDQGMGGLLAAFANSEGLSDSCFPECRRRLLDTLLPCIEKRGGERRAVGGFGCTPCANRKPVLEPNAREEVDNSQVATKFRRSTSNIVLRT